MQAALSLRGARLRAGLTQRQLAARCRVPHSSVARIESGSIVPRVDTLYRLLEACGETLEVRERRGIGVDRTLIREQLTRTPEKRLAFLASSAAGVSQLVAAARRGRG